MKAEIDCDILVVGAGPAGSSAAAVAAQEGAATFLIDSKPRIGEQPHCGEFVPVRLFSEFGLDRSSVIQTVESMETLVTGPSFWGESPPTACTPSEARRPLLTNADEPFMRTIQVPSPGFMIDRIRFDRDLAREAAASGSVVMSSSRLISAAKGVWTVKTAGTEEAFRPRFVIAADGALSTVASILGLPRLNFVSGLQVEAPLTRPLDRTMIFLDRKFVTGYGWLFPKGRVANVGIGANFPEHASPSATLDRFLAALERIGILRQGVLARTAGVIPVSGLRDSLVVDEVLFCGDAAGLTHPISGAGIPQAVISGRLVGRAVVNALKTGDRAHLKGYESQIRGQYRGVIGHALAKRHLMTRDWNAPDFEELCEETWIGFKGYRKRVR
jgi:digeranylgeranylglycerophospholipid reductase